MTKYYVVGMTPQLVILSEAEGSPADWLRSLHCGRDDSVGRVGKTKYDVVGMAPQLVILSAAEGSPADWLSSSLTG